MFSGSEREYAFRPFLMTVDFPQVKTPTTAMQTSVSGKALP
jgi:hypothetical protein